jgi:hypothetical protein
MCKTMVSWLSFVFAGAAVGAFPVGRGQRVISGAFAGEPETVKLAGPDFLNVISV